MLIEFNFSNYRSLRDEDCLSMEAAEFRKKFLVIKKGIPQPSSKSLRSDRMQFERARKFLHN